MTATTEGKAETRACKACEHLDRKVIDSALALGQAPRSIMRRYSGLSRRSIEKHRDECLAERGGEGDS